jgi:hypothetical protein
VAGGRLGAPAAKFGKGHAVEVIGGPVKDQGDIRHGLFDVVVNAG